LSGYVDFFVRYPESPLARVAELNVHSLTFAVVHELDSVDEYEAFLQAFPRAAQVVVVMQLATQKAIALETEKLAAAEANPPADGLDEWTKKQSNALVTAWGLEFTNYVNLWGLPPALPPDATLASLLSAADSDKDAGAKLLSYHRLQRYPAVLTTVYPGTDASANFGEQAVNRAYFNVIISKLDDINTTLKKNNDELTSLLKDQFAATRDIMQTGFDNLTRSITNLGGTITTLQTAVTDGLQKIAGKLDSLNQGLGSVQQGLITINWDLNHIETGIDQTNDQLKTLNTSVQGVGQELQNLNTNVSNGFAFVGQQVSGLRDDVVRGFSQVQQAIGSIPQSDDAFTSFTKALQGGYTRFTAQVSQAGNDIRGKITQATGELKTAVATAHADLDKAASTAVDDTKAILARALSSLNGKIVAFDFSTAGSLSFNLQTGTNFGTLEVPAGLVFDTKEISTESLPALDFDGALQLAARALGMTLVVKDDYETARTNCLNNAPGANGTAVCPP